jgi:DNA-binding helix-turn-helix protein
MLRIKEIRKDKKLSQKVIAAKIGVSERTFIDYENEKADVSLQVLRKIADALECSIIDLIEKVNVQQSNSIGHNVLGDRNKVGHIDNEILGLLRAQLEEKDRKISEKDEYIKTLVEKLTSK